MLRCESTKSNSSSNAESKASVLPLGSLLRLVKNLRGVVYAPEPPKAAEHLRWVRRKFQYRTVGYTPSSEARFRRYGLGELLAKKPFHMVSAPSAPVLSLVEICREAVKDPDLVEVLLLASVHIAPVLLLGAESTRRAAEFTLYTLEASPLTDAEAKRHMRILDYAILDAHADSCRRGAEALAQAGRHLSAGKLSVARRSISLALKQQGRFAEEDCNKRFWRLIESRGEDASPTVLYLHPLGAVRSVLKNQDNLAGLAELIDCSVAALEPCLSLVPALVVRPGKP